MVRRKYVGAGRSHYPYLQKAGATRLHAQAPIEARPARLYRNPCGQSSSRDVVSARVAEGGDSREHDVSGPKAFMHLHFVRLKVPDVLRSIWQRHHLIRPRA
eukprot:6208618-Pleurochrysis_carterae.AAC.2